MKAGVDMPCIKPRFHANAACCSGHYNPLIEAWFSARNITLYGNMALLNCHGAL